MIARNCDGNVPQYGTFSAEDTALLESAYGLADESRPFMDQQQIHRALDAIWRVVADANRYFAAQEPWALKKTDPDRMNTVLYATAETIRIVGILSQFVMPQSAGKLLDLLAVPAETRDFSRLYAAHGLIPGTALPAPEGIFPRWVEPESVA
jgi:methionyl-tRNA synthetase